MSMTMDWTIRGKHADGSCLTGEEVRELVALDEYDLEDAALEADTEWLGDFFTDGRGAYADILSAVTAFAENHMDVKLEVTYRYETACCPDGFVAENGRIRHTTGHVTYTYDDNGEEVK